MEHRPARRTRPNRTRVAAITFGAIALLSPLAACGDSDDSSSTTEPDTTSESGSGAGAAETQEFCEQAFTTDAAMSAATNGEEPDQAAVDAAKAELTTLKETAPDDVADVADAVASSSEELFTAQGPPSEAFTSSFGELVGWMADNCGYQVVDVSAKEYAFTDLPAELDPGKTIVRLTNTGNEVHEIAFAKRKDGTTEPLEELLALPEEVAGAKIDFLSSGFAMPGGSGAAMLDLSKGDYIAVCFVPTGTTAEAMASADGPPADAMPHAMQGMTGEFTVS